MHEFISLFQVCLGAAPCHRPWCPSQHGCCWPVIPTTSGIRDPQLTNRVSVFIYYFPFFNLKHAIKTFLLLSDIEHNLLLIRFVMGEKYGTAGLWDMSPKLLQHVVLKAERETSFYYPRGNCFALCCFCCLFGWIVFQYAQHAEGVECCFQGMERWAQLFLVYMVPIFVSHQCPELYTFTPPATLSAPFVCIPKIKWKDIIFRRMHHPEKGIGSTESKIYVSFEQAININGI